MTSALARSAHARRTQKPARRGEPSAHRLHREALRLLFAVLEDRHLMALNPLAEHLTDSSPTDPVLAQIDAGSVQDLAIAKANNTLSVDVRLGGAGGTFGPALPTDGGDYLNSIAAGNFDGGSNDLVTAGYADVSFLHGNGDGTYQLPVSIALPPQNPPN